MNAPVPIAFIATVVIALATSLFSGSDPMVTTVYSSFEHIEATWDEQPAPIDRRIALILNDGGLQRFINEQTSVEEALEDVDVDFSTEVLLVATMGTMPTDGYEILIHTVRVIDDESGLPEVTMDIVVGSPDEDEDIVLNVITYPVDTVVTARDAWPTDVLRLLEEGAVALEVFDQDGTLWGPAFVYSDETSGHDE